MAQPFILRITDNLETVDFLSQAVQVADGGFDIGLPHAKRELGLIRPGFYSPLAMNYEYRDAKLRFAITGQTRADVLTHLHKLERILRNIANRMRVAAGRRGELAYAWEGSNNITYFEIYGGDISFPNDLLSVAKIHALSNGMHLLPDCELSLQLSAYGYGLSIYSDDLTEVPLYNPSVAGKQTGGVKIQNPRQTTVQNYHWVEIEGADLPGSQPLLAKVVLNTDTPYSRWAMMYMGLQQQPYPTKIIFDSEPPDLAWGSGATVPSAEAEGGSYRQLTFGGRISHSFFSTYAWSVSNDTVGMFYAFYHAASTIPNDMAFAIGVDDYVSFGIRFQEDYVTPLYSSTVPLGAIQLPPTRLELKDYGVIHPDLWLGLWVVVDNDAGGTMTLDSLSLLPIANGLRMWRTRVSHNVIGSFIDDGWRGLEYFKASADGRVSSPFYALLEPLRLEPGVNQRIYFTSFGDAGLGNEKSRAFKVRVYVVPTYLTLAL
jgi:hypothetical protein